MGVLALGQRFLGDRFVSDVKSQLREVSMARFEEAHSREPGNVDSPLLQKFPESSARGRENVSLKYF